MPWTENNGVKIYYEIEGDGEPILFFSGVGGGTWSWYKQLPYFTRNYEVIVFDNRGAGKSDKPKQPYSMNDFVDDGVAILDKLGIWKTFVVGVSMGGMIAQSFAVSHPKRVRGLVLGATHCGGSERIPPEPEVLACFMDNEGLTDEEIIEKNTRILFSANFLLKHPTEVEEYKRVQLQAGVQPQYALENQLMAIRNFSCCHMLHHISAPTLIIAGSDDILVPPENSRILNERIENSKLVILPDVGHAIHVEAAEKFNIMVDEFFKRISLKDESR